MLLGLIYPEPERAPARVALSVEDRRLLLLLLAARGGEVSPAERAGLVGAWSAGRGEEHRALHGRLAVLTSGQLPSAPADWVRLAARARALLWSLVPPAPPFDVLLTAGGAR